MIKGVERERKRFRKKNGMRVDGGGVKLLDRLAEQPREHIVDGSAECWCGPKHTLIQDQRTRDIIVASIGFR